MGNVDERDAHLLLDAFKFLLHVLAQPEVQSPERLVQKEDLGPVHQSTGDSHALLLAAGKTGDLAVLEALERNNLQHLGHALVDLGLGNLLRPQAESDVVVYVQMREQSVLLKYGVHLAFVRRNVVDALPVKQNVPRGRL